MKSKFATRFFLTIIILTIIIAKRPMHSYQYISTINCPIRKLDLYHVISQLIIELPSNTTLVQITCCGW